LSLDQWRRVRMQDIEIAGRRVGPGHPCFIVAEAGVNHNGDADVARRLVRAAAQAGADAVKFQTFKAERLAIEGAPKADYQLQITDPAESQLAMLRKLELTTQAYTSLVRACEDEKILFLSTPYDIEDVDFIETLGIQAFKVASGQIVEPMFLRHVASKRKPIILSTGMATFAEVDEAVRTICNAGNDKVILLQCTTNYPSRPEDANLRAMQTMREALGVQVGYSDHTQTETACLVAVALGACVIEKHFTLDKAMPGPDHSSSADPAEFGRLVKLIREAEIVLGSSLKQPVDAERRNALGMRRSIVARQLIPCGGVITEQMLTLKRPGTGIRPSRLPELIGRKAARNIQPDELVTWDALQP